jgi:AmmeMemoRadiSam system protein B
MKKWKYSVIAIIIVFVSGCSHAPDSLLYSLEEVVSAAAYTDEFQYAAPWDTDLYENAYERAKEIQPDISEQVKGGIVPHHLISAHTIAAFFETIKKQDPSVVVLIGPNHFDQGSSFVLSTERDWKTPFGNVKTDHDNIALLKQKGTIGIGEAAFKEEHSVYSLIPFIKKSLPNTKVLPLILKNVDSRDHLDTLVKELTAQLPDDAVILASIDFSHYQTLPVAEFHDERSMNIVRNSDFERLSNIEIDSIPSLYTFLKLMEQYGTQRVASEHHTNSASIVGVTDEIETTSHYIPYFVAGEPEPERVVSILQFGDMMLDRNVANRMAKNGGAEYIFEAIAGKEERFFSGMDIVTANLEGPFANYRRDTTKEIAFRFDPVIIPTLQRYQFNLFTLASNHSLDMGRSGLVESKENLTEAGIPYYGNQFTVADDSLLIQETAGKKIAYLGLNDTHNSMDEETVLKLLLQAEEEADITIVNIHWGVEYKPLSHERQRMLAHKFIDQGADIIIGHHPHVVQEIEIYNDAPIFYSLGNFVFDQYFSVPTQQSLGVGMTLYDKKISLYVFPLEGEQSQVRQMSPNKGRLFMQHVIDRSRLDAYTFDTHFHLELPL